MTLEEKVAELEKIVKRQAVLLNVVREDIVLIEEGVRADIERLENKVFSRKGFCIKHFRWYIKFHPRMKCPKCIGTQ